MRLMLPKNGGVDGVCEPECRVLLSPTGLVRDFETSGTTPGAMLAPRNESKPARRQLHNSIEDAALCTAKRPNQASIGR